MGKGQILHGRVLQGLTRFFVLPPSRQAQLSILTTSDWEDRQL